MQKIALIGACGSIGRQVCEVVARYPEQFCFSALASGSNAREIERLAARFHPALAAVASGEQLSLPAGTRALAAEEITAHIFEGCDIAMIAAGGFAGLAYTLAAAREGRRIALANKESLVCGGALVMPLIARTGADLVPVDSEHSALFQALGFRRDAPFERLVLTASGGPFLHWQEEALARATARDALKHPTWSMGAKITIDSATLLNKGYEVIEAKWLYHTQLSRIRAVVHPESIVHSLVYFADGTAMAQMGYPDMRVPIQLALTYPERLPCQRPLDLAALGALHFERLPVEKFPCFSLALAAEQEGGTAPTVLNAAAEVAVYAFLQGRICFLQIADTIKDALSREPTQRAECYEQLKETDARTRRRATEFIYGS